MSNYAATIMADAPGAYWRLGESSGTSVADQTGTNTGTYVGSPTLGVTGALNADPNTAITLNGSSQYATVASNASMDFADVLSCEAWIKLSDLTVASTQIVRRGVGAYSFAYAGNAGAGGTANRVLLNKGGTGVIAMSSATITDTTRWHHVVATKNGATIHLYVDGAEGTANITNQTLTNSADTLNIGRHQTASEYFKGSLDEIALYNYALTAGQVTAHFRAGVDYLAAPASAAMVLTASTPAVSAAQAYVPTVAAMALTPATPVVSAVQAHVPSPAELALAFGTPVVAVTTGYLPPGIKASIVRTGQITATIQ